MHPKQMSDIEAVKEIDRLMAAAQVARHELKQFILDIDDPNVVMTDLVGKENGLSDYLNMAFQLSKIRLVRIGRATVSEPAGQRGDVETTNERGTK